MHRLKQWVHGVVICPCWISTPTVRGQCIQTNCWIRGFIPGYTSLPYYNWGYLNNVTGG